MEFTFTDEQEQFRDVVSRFMSEASPPGEVRRLMETATGFDTDQWRRVSEDLGLPAVHIPEAYGGQGFGMVELGLVLEEMGRALFTGPYFSSTVLAAGALLNCATDEEKAELIPPIAAGTSIATLALTDAGNTRAPTDLTRITTEIDAAGHLTGCKDYVLDGSLADLILVAARAKGSEGASGLSLYAVAGDAAGMTRENLPTVDLTRKLSRLTFSATPARPIGEAGNATAGLARTLDEACIALASEMVGGAQYLLDSAVAYTQSRMQFGRPIASFQAIKHRCADLLLDVELSKSAAYHAAEVAAAGADDVPALASLAKASAADTYMQAAAACIQLHGGIGFTFDNDTHLWFKRAKASEVLLGDPSWHRERMLTNWRDSI